MSKRKDWTGQKYNKLTFIKPTDRRVGTGSVVWELLCDCGTVIYLNPPKVVSGKNKSCGCTGNSKDWTGIKLHMLTFIRSADIKNNKIQWETLCECGKTIYVAPCYVSSGHTKSCGCGFSNRKYTPEISSARNKWYSSYKDGDIDFETFYTLSQQNCHYCGSPPFRKYNVGNKKLITRKAYSSELQLQEGTFIYNGLDRIDSRRGHMLDNVVSCCYPCNLLKSDSVKEDFLDHIKRIYEHYFGQSSFIKTG